MRNLPHRKENLDGTEKQANKAAIENAINQILTVLAHSNDILILSQIGEIIQEDALQPFIEKEMKYSCTSLILYGQYLNSMSVHDSGESKAVKNVWTEGARVLTVQTLITEFSNNSFTARRDSRCDYGTLQTKPEEVYMLKSAGWLYSPYNQQ